MSNIKRFIRNQTNRKTVIFFIIIALIVAIQLHKLSITLTSRTVDGDNLLSDVNIIENGKVLYFDDDVYIIFSDGNNIVHYFDSDGNFLYSLCLSSYSTVDISYNSISNEFTGYYYRSQSNFIIDSNNVVNIDADSNNLELEDVRDCITMSDRTVCLSKNVFGRTYLSDEDDKVLLETNNIHYQLTLIILIFGLPISLVFYLTSKQAHLLQKKFLKEKDY